VYMNEFVFNLMHALESSADIGGGDEAVMELAKDFKNADDPHTFMDNIVVEKFFTAETNEEGEVVEKFPQGVANMVNDLFKNTDELN
jgi:hypothetical protein